MNARIESRPYRHKWRTDPSPLALAGRHPGAAGRLGLGVRTRGALAAAALALALVGTLALRGAERPLEIKLVTLAPRGTTPHLLLLKMGEEWLKASGGRVRLTVIPDYRAGGEAAMVDKMGIGGIDAALMTVVGLSKIDEGVTALASMPMMFRSLEEVDRVGERLKPELAERLARKGYVALFWSDLGWLRFFSVEPMLTPEDLKRMKVFTWAGSAAQIDLMKDWGTKPVALEPADIFTSLQTGMIEVVPATPFTANAGQFAQKTRHMLEVNWAPLVGGAVIRKKIWERVPAELQAGLLAAAEAIGAQIKTAGRKESDEAVEAMKSKQGLQVHRPGAEAEEQWRQAAQSVYPRIRGGLVPPDMFDKVQAVLGQYRGGSAAKP